MNKHNINVGDTVRIIGNSNEHGFKIGQEVTVNEIRAVGLNIERLKCSDKDDWWYITYQDIEPVSPTEHTFDGWAVFDEKGTMFPNSLFLNKEYMPILYDAELQNGAKILPVSVTVKIKQNGKED